MNNQESDGKIESMDSKGTNVIYNETT